MTGTRSITHASVGSWLRYQFMEKKLNTLFGYFLLALIGVTMIYFIVLKSYLVGPIAIAAIAGICIMIAILKYPYFGFYFLLCFAAVTTTIERMVPIPFSTGLIVELFTYMLLFRIMLKYELKKSVDSAFWTNPITICFYIQFAYYIIELFNPAMHSQLGWFSFFRRQLSFVIYFYMCYSLLDTREKILYYVHFLIGLTTFCALYACKQQWFGYSGFELRWIGTGAGMTLLLQAGVLRKFSVFSDPATSGILFASVSMLCIVLLLRGTEKKQRPLLWFCMIVNLLGYSFSGTRTATLIIIAGICLYCLATLSEKRSMYFLIGAAGLLILMIISPVQTPVTNRILSTFEGTKDLSAAVRDFDRHQVQPYIQEHPLGGGVFTCGAEGPKYNPGHPLETLQPDSGYMKQLAELGPIGLAILLIFYYVILQYGIRNFFSARDPQIRNYYIGLTMMMFCLMVAQYSQMAITQYPVTLFFDAILVIFIRLSKFDTPAPEPEPETIQINA